MSTDINEEKLYHRKKIFKRIGNIVWVVMFLLLCLIGYLGAIGLRSHPPLLLRFAIIVLAGALPFIVMGYGEWVVCIVQQLYCGQAGHSYREVEPLSQEDKTTLYCCEFCGKYDIFLLPPRRARISKPEA